MGEVVSIEVWQARAEPYLLPYDPEVVAAALGAPEVVLPGGRCMEDRPVQPDQEILMLNPAEEPERVIDLGLQRLQNRQGGLWTPHGQRELAAPDYNLWTPDVATMVHDGLRTGSSLPGGLGGVTLNRVLAMEVERPGSFTNLGMPIDVAASTIAKILGETGEFHQDCKAWDSAQAILAFMSEHPDQAFKTARQVSPDVSPELFERTVDAAGRLVASGLVRTGQPEGVAVRPLISHANDPTQPVEHQAKFVAAIRNERGDQVLWNTRGAWHTGQPGYALNVPYLKHFAAQTNSSLNHVLGKVDIDTFTAVGVAYQGATIPNLPGRPVVVPIQEQAA